jgi:hypothetical protein
MKVFSLANMPSLLPLIADFQAIFRRYPPMYGDVIPTLCANLEELDEPEAKASLIWTIGEYTNKIDNGTFVDTFTEVLLCASSIQLSDASLLTHAHVLGTAADAHCGHQTLA